MGSAVQTTTENPVQMSGPTLAVSQLLNAQECYYVNRKQYKRILIRRQARDKLIAEGRIPIERSVSASNDGLKIRQFENLFLRRPILK